jgi:hypothetical protein
MVDKHAPIAAQSRAARCILNRANAFRFEDLQAQIENLEQIRREHELNEAKFEETQDISYGPHGEGKATPRKTNASLAKIDTIILALLEHGSHAKAAAACGMSPVTVWRWSRKPEFQEQCRKALREAHSSATAVLQQGASAAMSLQKRMLTDKAPTAVPHFSRHGAPGSLDTQTGLFQRWETEVMGPIDKKIEKDVNEGKIPEPIEDLPSEWAKENREIDGAKPDLGELEEDPSEL